MNGLRWSGALAALTVLLAAGPAHAGVPAPRLVHIGCFGVNQLCPERCGVEVVPPSGGCQHLQGVTPFDPIEVLVTLRTSFDLPVTNCSTSVVLVPNAGTNNFCSCCPTRSAGFTDANGVLQATFSGIGGYGTLDAWVTAHCAGNIAVAQRIITYTSPDLGGSCDAANSTGVVDLARWAEALTTYLLRSDYDCSTTITVIDLGLWATGLGEGCADAVCP